MDTFTIIDNLIDGRNDDGTPAIEKMIFGSRRKKAQDCKRAVLRPVVIKRELKFQIEFHTDKSVMHENLAPEEAKLRCAELVSEAFKQINIITRENELQILAKNPEKPRVIKKARAAAKPVDLSHNREKRYILPENVPVPFLVRLGVTDPEGRVYNKHYSKFRQINRYLEIFDDVIDVLPDKKLKIIDFGCGKAYLTFALYHYLRVIKGREAEIVGLDLKKDVIEFCSDIARELDMTGLRFLVGDIADYREEDVDAVVTLHACDTATDLALINAVNWNARVILSVPCCQHELFSQISSPLHEPLYKHGILKDRFTEILTDGLRGLKLESKGYDVSMIEFTSLEHTARNIMIRAVKNPEKSDCARALSEYIALRDYYGLRPTIDRL